MIDLHTHVLPGIDDGADDLAAAVAMCRAAAADGCETLFATPHQRTEHWDNGDLELLAELRRQVEEAAGGSPRIAAGAEIRVGSSLLDDLADPTANGLQPLADSKYLLLELSRYVPPPDPVGLTHELIVAGWTPIYAHPELIPYLARDPGLLHDLAAAGALFQVTAASVTGEMGRDTRTLCRRMLDDDLVHFVASDAHGVTWRPPGLAAVRRAIAARWGEETADRVTRGNPRAVLEDRPLQVPAAH